MVTNITKVQLHSICDSLSILLIYSAEEELSLNVHL